MTTPSVPAGRRRIVRAAHYYNNQRRLERIKAAEEALESPDANLQDK